jgi:hypothetical protein
LRITSIPFLAGLYTLGANPTGERAVSPPNSVRLDGGPGLGAFIYRGLSISPTAQIVSIEAWVNSTRSNSNNAIVRLGDNCSGGPSVRFDPNGSIHAGNVADNDKYHYPLPVTYTVDTWIKVRVDVHLPTSSYDIAVNGTVVGTGFPGGINPSSTVACIGSDNNIFAGTGGGTSVYFDDVRVTETSVIDVTIDVKPGSYPNSINLSAAGVIPVAILSSSTFHAQIEVDPATLTLAGAKVKVAGKSDKFLCHSEDVNADGLQDLVCQFQNELNAQIGDSIAVLEGDTYSGVPIRGQDSIRIVPD